MCDFSPCAEACRLQNLLFVCSRRDEHSSGQIPGPRADGRRIVPLKRRSVTDCGRIIGNSYRISRQPTYSVRCGLRAASRIIIHRETTNTVIVLPHWEKLDNLKFKLL